MRRKKGNIIDRNRIAGKKKMGGYGGLEINEGRKGEGEIKVRGRDR